MSLNIPFDNSYAQLPDHMFAAQAPEPVAAPELIQWNQPLADSLGITGDPNPQDLAALFSGNALPAGSTPIAQLYAGHQFGNWNPQLGDGRAVLLGEVVTSKGRFDLQLKGSGRTPFSRNGDGRAWLGPVLREYLMSEAMHAMGIPTTRALAAVTTGQKVQRETALPGAVLTRIAASHIRVGTFQIFAARQDLVALRALYDHVVARHYPTAQSPGDLLQQALKRQAELVAQWMSVGFIHGVMNTDNCQIAGETIDYGPCAFMDEYHTQKVFSSIDQRGRYAYGNQPRIAVWNMAQFATALIPLMPDQDAAVEEFTEIVNSYPSDYDAAWLARFGAKLGLRDPQQDHVALIEDLLHLMQQDSADFTNVFAALGQENDRDQFTDHVAFETWRARWMACDPDLTLMAQTNPMVVPRLHQIEAVIQAGVAGDFAPFYRMLDVVTHPFDQTDQTAAYRDPPLPTQIVPRTFCGT